MLAEKRKIQARLLHISLLLLKHHHTKILSTDSITFVILFAITHPKHANTVI